MAGLIKIIVGFGFLLVPIIMIASHLNKQTKPAGAQDQFKQEWGANAPARNDVKSSTTFDYDRDKQEASMKIKIEITPRQSYDTPSDYSAPMVSTAPAGER